MKIGDKVRFLSEVGGGVVTGFQGKDMVLVEDADGFDIPMPIKECVVIDTDDYNMKRKPVAPAPKQEVAGAKAKGASVKVRPDEEEDERPVTYRPAERKGGDILNVMLAFVPQDLKAISATASTTAISPYTLLILQPKVVTGGCAAMAWWNRIRSFISRSSRKAF